MGSRKMIENDGDKEEAFATFENSLTVQASCKKHREQGLWAFDTANPNAWPGAAEYMEVSSADAVLLQEARVLAEATSRLLQGTLDGERLSVDACREKAVVSRRGLLLHAEPTLGSPSRVKNSSYPKRPGADSR